MPTFTNSKSLRLSFLFCLLINFSPIFGQITIQSNGYPNDQGTLAVAAPTFSAGQSFTSTADGVITSISLKVDNNNIEQGDLKLWIGVNPPNNVIFPLNSPAQATATVNATNLKGIVTFDFSNNPFPVKKGEKYRFQFNSTAAGGMIFSSSFVDTYPDGDNYDAGGDANIGFDLVFSIAIHETIIPTLSQWGLFLFGLLILNLGVFFLGKLETNKRLFF